MSIMTVYRVEIRESALRDLAELRDYLRTVMSRDGSHRHVENMRNEVMSLAVFADMYRPSPMTDIRQYHPKARRMVSHNKRWVYFFHVEDDLVIVDRIRPAKTIAK